MTLIGITGRLGSGKDEVAKIIQRLEPGWEVKKFAGKLKQICGILAGVDPVKFEDQEFKKQMSPFGMTYRELLQKVGTEGMRNNIDKDVWVKALFADFIEQYTIDFSKIPEDIRDDIPKAIDYVENVLNISLKNKSPNSSSKWIITDVRFPNEADAIKERGGYLISVSRKKFVSWRDEETGITFHSLTFSPFDHPSETAMDDYEGIDVYIDNNGTLEELEEKVKSILNTINNDKQDRDK